MRIFTKSTSLRLTISPATFLYSNTTVNSDEFEIFLSLELAHGKEQALNYLSAELFEYVKFDSTIILATKK